MIVAAYIFTSFIAIDSGSKDIINKIIVSIDPEEMGKPTLNYTKTMPVVHFTVNRPHIYINTSTAAFEKNFYVGMAQFKELINGTRVAEYTRFKPCSEVDNDLTANFTYLDTYKGNLFFTNVANEAVLSGLNVVSQAESLEGHVEIREEFALCPTEASMDDMDIGANYNEFLHVSDVQIIVTTCMLAADEKIQLLSGHAYDEVSGLPDVSECAAE